MKNSCHGGTGLSSLFAIDKFVVCGKTNKIHSHQIRSDVSLLLTVGTSRSESFFTNSSWTESVLILCEPSNYQGLIALNDELTCISS